MDILSTLFASLPSLQGGFNFLDVIILCIILFYVHEGYTLGFTLATLDLVSFIISFIAALQFYTNVAWFLTTFFALPIGIANAAGFFLIAFLSEIVLTILSRRGIRYLPGSLVGYFPWPYFCLHYLILLVICYRNLPVITCYQKCRE
jgi:hypothetical protein